MISSMDSFLIRRQAVSYTHLDTPYEAWGFGDVPDQLADLVLTGIKTATASAYDLSFMEGEADPLPQSGDYLSLIHI